MKLKELIESKKQSVGYKKLTEFVASESGVTIRASRGSHNAVLAAAVASEMSGVHLLVMDNRDQAGYIYNDLYALTEERGVNFFPTSYKKSIEYGQEDPSGVVQRTTVLNEVRNMTPTDTMLICTYPEALAEMVAAKEQMAAHTLTLKVGQTLDLMTMAEMLIEMEFSKVDFVYEPGQFSIRGGIFDIFSYAENNPYRVDLFDTEVESIRVFDINTQLSIERRERIDIVPNLKESAIGNEKRMTLLDFIGATKTLWVNDIDYTLRRIGEIRVKVAAAIGSDGGNPREVDGRVVSKAALREQFQSRALILINEGLREMRVDNTVEFHTDNQPSFNKNFELLAQNLDDSTVLGYKNYILTDNKAQIERLENIFNSIGKKNIRFENISADLHHGYTDADLKINVYTDHQIFLRHHKFTLHREIKRSEAMTLGELNSMKIGDYVVHIDHGVGRFGGLIKTTENGKVSEAIKLVYRDNDVLLVNVHALHRISKYKDKDADQTKIHKLGSGAWQRLKQTTKAKVKDIAKELIALYAKRKASLGFSFSPDTYMQSELEASFMYDDTPDQEKATKAIKEDMESSAPMDRLICGDVGFGKTEIAMRAAFKAVSDSKQVAVLVPTTILCLQHYRSFSKRFKEFPVRVEHLSRAKTAKQTKEILEELKQGKIDVLIGTHKILGKSVEFKDLGLLIIDEEQKFGVSSKEKLRQMKANIDTLTLTATPIPRTLQFSLMGSRDLSIINTPPPNRQSVETQVHLFDEDLIRDAINLELDRAGQIYFLHNRVGSIMDIKALVERLCPRARVAVGHGQMNPDDLEKLMMDFIYGEYDVLVATTIIESGIDIPNANTMIINNGHLFGLSDLHQLRGRVGRSNRKAYCYILTQPDENLSDDARRRLRAIEEFSDLGAGFNLAMQDLDIRGAGNILGGEQSGFIADVGFETYQKILNEAMLELRDEQEEVFIQDTNSEGETLTAEGDSAQPKAKVISKYISDCLVETDREALIPDSYIGSAREKIILYRELDNLESEENLEKFAAMLRDRFGEIPPQTIELFNIVRMRWLCVELGFEKVLMKNGIMILYFVGDQKSNYYKTAVFAAILKFVTQNGKKFTFKQYNNKLQISVKDITGSDRALETIKKIYEAVI